ncbi:MAG: transporter related [Caulobacteraceae bacterium]|nr:transporter related [Caulobacteraceae bacterium]
MARAATVEQDPILGALSVSALSKAYGKVQALSQVGFEVGPGEVFGLLGPNGAGKTTTLECIGGLRRADAGRIEIDGIDMARQPRRAKARIGMVLQSTGLQTTLTPREVLAAFGALYPSRLAPAPLLERFGLTAKADARIATLSGGQKQRLALALAFVSQPSVLVFDEPSHGLDPQARRDLHGLIREMKAEGRTIIIATHDMDEAAQLCDRIGVLSAGRIIAQGRPSDLTDRDSSSFHVMIRTSRPITLPAKGAPKGLEGLAVEGDELRFKAASLGTALGLALPWLEGLGVEISEVKAERASLQDVILHLIDGSGHAGA